jgi:hypothetical protein
MAARQLQVLIENPRTHPDSISYVAPFLDQLEQIRLWFKEEDFLVPAVGGRALSICRCVNNVFARSGLILHAYSCRVCAPRHHFTLRSRIGSLCTDPTTVERVLATIFGAHPEEVTGRLEELHTLLQAPQPRNAPDLLDEARDICDSAKNLLSIRDQFAFRCNCCRHCTGSYPPPHPSTYASQTTYTIYRLGNSFGPLVDDL